MPTYLLSEEVLNNSPTVQANVPHKIEMNNRIFICQLIERAGRMLKLPITTVITSQIIVHRFYYRQDMLKHKALPVAMTSLFLATKVEESPRKIRDILNVFDRVLKKQQGLVLTPFDTTSQRYESWRRRMKNMELIILAELGYVLYVDHPHKLMLHYLRALQDDNDMELWKEVAQRAWNFLNDSFRTNLCLRFRPEVLATASIYLTFRIMGIPVPDNPPWYTVFDVRLIDLQEVSISYDIYIIYTYFNLLLFLLIITYNIYIFFISG